MGAGGIWGHLELRFTPLGRGGWIGFIDNDWVRLVLYIAVFSFIAFYFYLGRTLKQLDPGKAVPSRVRSALDTMAGGLLVIDAGGNIVLANTAFTELLAVEPETLVGKTARELDWRCEEDEALAPDVVPWESVIQTGVASRNETLRLATDNGMWTFIVNSSPVLGEGDRRGGVLVSFDDVTALEAKEVELRKSKQDADEANAAKSAFLASMSHEIRTPMNAILGFTDLLKRGKIEPQDSLHYLSTIHSSGKHLLDLINDILDLSKVESGRLEIEQAGFSAYQIVSEVVTALSVKAEEKDIELTLVEPVEFPVTVTSDPARLRQIVTNVIGNAIKFTSVGGVTVAPSIRQDGGSAVLEVAVTDTGTGIDPAQQQRIFDPFTQADSSVTRKFGGTGLGLAISRRLANSLGGDITVASEIGQGSCFTIVVDAGDLENVRWLPPSELLLSAAGSGAGNDAEWQFPAARILVVDDGAENRELVRLVLGDVGLSVDEADNGSTGVDAATKTAYDLILMDLNMPVMDGATAVTRLRELDIKTPVIALTADAMKGTEQRLREVGFAGYLTKPIDIDSLMAELAVFLGGYQVIDGTAGLESEAPRPEASQSEAPRSRRAPGRQSA